MSLPLLLVVALPALAIGLAVLLLQWLNVSSPERHRQRGVPVLALVYGCMVTAVLLAARWQWLPWSFTYAEAATVDPLRAFDGVLRAATSPMLAVDLPPRAAQAWVAVADAIRQFTLVDRLTVALLLGFAALKATRRASLAVWSVLRRTARWAFRRSSDPRGEVVAADDRRVSVDDPFYRFVPGQGIVLRPEWAGIRIVLLVAAAAWGALLWAALALERLRSDVPLPLLAALPLLLLLECAWYLGGRQARPAPASLAADDEPVRVEGHYRELWDRYRAQWSSWMAAARSDAGSTGAARHALDHLEAMLKSGVDVLAPTVEREAIEELLLKHATGVLARGDDVVVLLPDHAAPAPAVQWLETWFDQRLALPHTVPVRRWGQTVVAAELRVPQVIVVLPDEIVHADAMGPVANTRLIVLTNVGDGMADPVPEAWALNRLRAAAPAAQLVLLGEPRENLGDAVRRNLPAAPVEIRPPRRLTPGCYVLAWPTDVDRWYQQTLFTTHAPSFVGVEAVLALKAWAAGAITVRLGDQRTVPWLHYAEVLQNHRHFLRTGVVRDEDIQAQLETLVRHAEDSWFSPTDTRSVLVVRDEAANLPATVDKWSGRAVQGLLLHVVSPPYLLRDYFVAHLDYFHRSPVLALSPKIEQRQAAAWALARQLIEAPLREHDVHTILSRIDEGPRATGDRIEDRVRRLLASVADAPQCARLQIDPKLEFIDGEVRQQLWFSLPEDFRSMPAYELWSVVDEAGHTLVQGRESQVRSRYGVQQLHAIGGRTYRVRRHEPSQRRIVVAKAAPRGEPRYRTVAHYLLRPNRNAGHRPTPEGTWEQRHQCVMRVTHWQGAELVVRRLGFLRYMGATVRRPADGAEFYRHDPAAHGEPGEPPPLRDPQVRRFEFRPADIAGNPASPWDATEDVAATLALLLNEMVPTLFPGSESLLHVLAPTSDRQPAEDDYLRRLVLEARDCPGPAGAGPLVEFYVIEDSEVDNGLARAFFEEWPVIFALLFDYLSWWLDPQREAQQRRDRGFVWLNEGQPKPFLHLGGDSVPEELALEGVRDLLRALGCGEDGTRNSQFVQRSLHVTGELPAPADPLPTLPNPQALAEADAVQDADVEANPVTADDLIGDAEAAGEGVGSADVATAHPEPPPPSDDETASAFECSFCHESSTVDVMRVGRGRLRCARCSLTALTRHEQMAAALEDARTVFRQAFGETARRVSVEFSDRFAFHAGGGSSDLGPWQWPAHLPPPAGTDPRSLVVNRGGDLCLLVMPGMPYAPTVAECLKGLVWVWMDDHLDLDGVAAHCRSKAWVLLPDDAFVNTQVLLQGARAWSCRQALAKAGWLPAWRDRLSAAAAVDADDTFERRGVQLIDQLVQRQELPAPFGLLASLVQSQGPAEAMSVLQRQWPRVRRDQPKPTWAV